MDIKDGDLKINIILKDQNNLLANATISLGTTSFGFVTIKGFQIWRSSRFNERLQETVNITPPTNMYQGKYFQQVFFEEPSKWFEIELKIYECFNLTRNETKGKRTNEDVDIDNNDL